MPVHGRRQGVDRGVHVVELAALVPILVFDPVYILAIISLLYNPIYSTSTTTYVLYLYYVLCTLHTSNYTSTSNDPICNLCTLPLLRPTGIWV